MYRKILLWAALALVLALVPASAASSPDLPQAQPNDFVPGQILVKFKPGTPGQTVADLHRQNADRVLQVIPRIGVEVVGVPAGQETARVRAYAANPNVQFAEVDGFYQADEWASPTSPGDTLYGSQWQYPKISAPAAWGVTHGSSSVKIAILDTGIDQDHPDLNPTVGGKVVDNKNFTTSSTVDDRYGHGTHVAGSAAAVTGNAAGVAGTCPNCSLMNVKVLGDNGSGSWSGIASGIGYAVSNGANVISMSLGGSSGSGTVETAINDAWGAGVVVVAAAGNSGSSSPSYPAYYPHVIAVAATTSTDAKASYSNYGSWVDVAAPGSSILSTATNHSSRIWTKSNTYGTISGTSMATPHVAGLAGLIWSSGPCGTGSPVDKATCVRGRIETKAERITGTGSYWTYGRINAEASLSSTSGGTNTAPVAYDQSVSTKQGTPVEITLTATDAESDALTFYIVSGPANGSLSPATGVVPGSPAKVIYTPPNTTFVGTDTFTFRAKDATADSNTATVSVKVNRTGGPKTKSR